MIDSLSALLGGLSPAALIALLVVLALQCILQIYCVVDLVRRPAVTGGRKWLWALIIVGGGLLGAIVYLAVGRAPASFAGSDAGAGDEDATRQAIDRLYGDKR